MTKLLIEQSITSLPLPVTEGIGQDDNTKIFITLPEGRFSQTNYINFHFHFLRINAGDDEFPCANDSVCGYVFIC